MPNSPFTVLVTVTDSDSGTGSLSYTLTVDPAIVVGPATLPVATVGDPYSQQLTVSGGSGTGYSFTTSSTLPTGLTLTTGGLLSGTPTSDANSPFTVLVTVTDSDNATGSLSYTLTVRSGHRGRPEYPARGDRGRCLQPAAHGLGWLGHRLQFHDELDASHRTDPDHRGLAERYAHLGCQLALHRGRHGHRQR